MWLIRFLSLLGFDISKKVHADIPERNSNYYVCFSKILKEIWMKLYVKQHC
jgi:hypothetical protein